jgi:hypothetical protein
MITFNVSNTRIEGDEIIAFFVFSNGEVNSNRFPLTTSFVDIMAWGTERAAWFERREIELAELHTQLLANQEVVNDNPDN